MFSKFNVVYILFCKMISIFEIICCINRNSSRKIIHLLEELQREDLSEEKRSRLRDRVAEEYKTIGYNDCFLKHCPLKKRKERGDRCITPPDDTLPDHTLPDHTLQDDTLPDDTFTNSSRKRKRKGV